MSDAEEAARIGPDDRQEFLRVVTDRLAKALHCQAAHLLLGLATREPHQSSLAVLQLLLATENLLE